MNLETPNLVLLVSPAEIVRSCLIDRGLVVMPYEPGRLLPVQPAQQSLSAQPGAQLTPCYTSGSPDDIDQVVFVKGTGGVLWGRRQTDGKYLEYPGIQVYCRALVYDVGYALAMTLAAGLAAILNTSTTLNNVVHYVKGVPRIGSIIELGEEPGRRRQCWSMNARLIMQDKEPSLG